MDELQRERLGALSSDRLHLIIMPTEKCNFRCIYCYEDFLIGRMKADIVSGTIRFIERRLPSLKHLHIGWFGGEPTLALDIIEDINRSVVGSFYKGINFTSSISTNGWLLSDDNLRRLTSVEVRTFQISLDGEKDLHDTTRITRAGEGTFDRIMGNICAAVASNYKFKISIRIHLHGNNIRSADNLIQTLIQKFHREPRISVYIKNIEPLGGNGDAQIAHLHDQTHLSELRLALEKAELYEKSSDQLICYAAMANSLIIRPDGRIGKCTVALNDVRNTIGSIDKFGRISVDNDRFQPWIRGLISGRHEEMACPLVDLEP